MAPLQGAGMAGRENPGFRKLHPGLLTYALSAQLFRAAKLLNYEFKNFFKLSKAGLAYARFFFFLAISSIK